VVLYIVLWALASIGNRVFHLSEDRRLIYKALGMFGNVGFMGIPLISELCPNSGMLYVALFTIVDQGLFWTLGASYCKPASAEKTGLNVGNLKKLLSPALVGIVLSIILVLCGVRFPTVIESSLQTVANASMPLSLIYIGGMLYFSDIRRVLRCWELYAQIVFKMTLLPIALYAVLFLLNMPQELCATMAVICGLPAISSVAMLCNQNGSDGDYATSAVMLTTVACVITLPLVSLGMALIG
jgi:predicted permease